MWFCRTDDSNGIVYYNGKDATVTQTADWKEWRIDLKDFMTRAWTRVMSRGYMLASVTRALHPQVRVRYTSTTSGFIRQNFMSQSVRRCHPTLSATAWSTMKTSR